MATTTGGVSVGPLKGFVDQLESLGEERKDLAEREKDIWSELQAGGYDQKVVREVLRRRRMKPAERAELDEMLPIYEGAVAS